MYKRRPYKLMRAFVIIALTFLSVISWDAFFKDKSEEKDTTE
ncbi:hypothetical protein bthur0007_44880 [Bacillus thuringiensis serovar monterrey BGSC 4AJ1]|nr:hypothetical protein bthur0007_44880 [Bacillus thuringiensis serovar monterrey BGSC 4AJ1]